MAYISYNKTWESEFDNIFSKKDEVQDMNINQLKLKVHKSYRKDEKMTTNFEPVDNDDVINKAHLDDNLSKVEGHISYVEKIMMILKYSLTNSLLKRFWFNEL